MIKTLAIMLLCPSLALAGTSVAVYDSTYTVAGQTIGTLDTAKTSISSINYDLPFSNGLWIVPTGDFGNLTIIYE